jgi:hypothetical protein
MRLEENKNNTEGSRKKKGGKQRVKREKPVE